MDKLLEFVDSEGEVYISDTYRLAFSASQEQEEPDSFPFAKCPSLTFSRTVFPYLHPFIHRSQDHSNHIFC
jgi:hypothetical protein